MYNHFMSLSAEGIYRERTRVYPRLSREEEVAYFTNREDHYRNLVYTLCKDSLATTRLRYQIIDYTTPTKPSLLEEFRSLEDRLRQRGGKNEENMGLVFNFLYKSSIPHRLIHRATDELLALRNEPKWYPKVRSIVHDLKSEEKVFFNSNAGLVQYWAKKYDWTGIPFLDRVQEGNIGVLAAIDRYDHHRGYDFSTYAGWCIRLKIQRSFGSEMSGPRFSAKAMAKVDTILTAQSQLADQLQREPTMQEIAKEVEMKPQLVEKYLISSRSRGSKMVYLDAPAGDESNSYYLLDQFNSTDSTSQNTIHDARLLWGRTLERIVRLPEDQQQLIKLRFGKELTLEEVGNVMNITAEWVRKKEERILVKLRRRLTSDKD